VASIVRRYPVPVVFTTALCVVSAVYVYALGSSGRRSLVAETATNLANLKTDPLGTMVASAFVPETTQWAWVVLAVVGLFPLVRRFGNLRALLLVGSAHVTGTLLSEGVLAWRIAAGAAPASMRFLDDVGPSYVITSALVAAALYGTEPARDPRARLLGRGLWWRLAAAASLVVLAPSLCAGLGHLDVAAVGHVVAIATGVVVGWVLTRSVRAVSVSGMRRTPVTVRNPGAE
jgi:hypothetical protein